MNGYQAKKPEIKRADKKPELVKSLSAAENSKEEWFDDRQTLAAPHGGEEGDGETLWLLSYADMMTLLFGFFVMMSSFSKIDMEEFEKSRMETTQLFGGQYKKLDNSLKKELQDQVEDQGFSDKAFFDDFERGVSITFRGSVIFDSASTEIKPESLDLLMKVIAVVKKQKRKYKVIVEGHTDDSPIANSAFPSNWELSGQRAAAVVRVFEAQGFPRSQLRAIGYADTLPVLPNRTPSNVIIPENQGQNRRVVIRLTRID